MRSTIGPDLATTAKSTPALRAMFRAMSLATKIWMIMASGETVLNMARSGFLRVSLKDGLLIAMDIGPGLRRGAGPGWKMNPGDSRHSTTVDGQLWAEDGAGFRVPW